MPTEHQRLAAEWRATADSIRQSRAQLYRLFAADEPPVTSHPQTNIALIDGLNVAIALEALAQAIDPKAAK
jgi:hypothetical protein